MTVYRGARRDPAGRYLVVVAEFNHWITDRLLRGALRAFAAAGVRASRVDVAWVPGSFELPAAAKAGVATGRYRGVVALGAVIRGETTHDEHVAAGCVQGLQAVAASTSIPITFGVITANTFDQAAARARLDGGRNMGAGAARAAVEMATLLDRLSR
ncbi:MAG: 6,7-dimethyl-8-ribityllumazine synthase [Candidatus Coatesbacteria bacterium]